MLRFSISVTHAKRNSGRQIQFVNKTFDFRSNFEYHLEIRDCCCELLYLQISLCCPDNDGNKVWVVPVNIRTPPMEEQLIKSKAPDFS